MRRGYGEDRASIADYVTEVFAPEDQMLKHVRTVARDEGLPEIHVGPMDGLHLEVLTRAVGAKKVVEIGTLAGYSGICFLRGMGLNGRLFTFEYSEKHARVARANFIHAGFANSFSIHVGEALTELKRIEPDGPFDIVFVDADKANYENYFYWAAKNLRVGGLLIGDNCFAFGQIAAEKFASKTEEKVVGSLHAFNVAVARHPEFRATMLPTGEGLCLAVKIV